MEKVIAVFDIGKTNKKVLLFDKDLKMICQREEKFQTTIDEEGDECDDINLIENWLINTISDLQKEKKYDVKAINFSTYGASLAFLDENGKRLTPIYNYLKEIPEEIQNELFNNYGGKEEFCRKTASPALGLMLNSGLQLLWMKKYKADIYRKINSILHFPQYLSYLFSGKICSEPTSIGCHTFMWDFDNNSYHSWLADERITLPEPEGNTNFVTANINGKEIRIGTGIHDSSASLAPYLLGSKENFMLVSTGTWSINMNPFNHSPLTTKQLENDCLSFLCIDQTPVKSSRLFMGHIHDANTLLLSKYFNVEQDYYKNIGVNKEILKKLLDTGKQKTFFRKGNPGSPAYPNYVDENINLSQFSSFEEAYHRLMCDISLLNSESMNLVFEENDDVKSIFISGGFARNEIFVKLMSEFYPDKQVFTSEIDNSSALGAALMVWDAISEGKKPKIDLGIK